MSGGASVTMILTSTGVAQGRLQDRTGALEVGPPLGGIIGLGQVEVVLGQCNYQIGIIFKPGVFNGAAVPSNPAA